MIHKHIVKDYFKLNRISFLLVAFVCFINTFSFSQRFDWVRHLDVAGSTCKMVLDTDGNTITFGGLSGSADFDPGAGSYLLTSVGMQDTYIQKLDSLGNFVWAHRFGGTENEFAYSLCIDHENNTIITGMFKGTVDFDPGPSVFSISSASNTPDFFIVKLNPSGDLIWAKSVGGIGNDYAKSIWADQSNNVYLTGVFGDVMDFDPGPGVMNITPASGTDVFILKLNEDGLFKWAKRIGSTQNDYGEAIKTDQNGNVYTTGRFVGTVDFNPNVGTSFLTSAGNDWFIQKLDSNGIFQWAKGFGALSMQARIFSMNFDANGNGIYSGEFDGTIDFDPGAGIYNMTSQGDKDCFILKLNNLGQFMWSKSFGGTGTDVLNSTTIDQNGYIYTTGQYMSTVDFDPNTGISNIPAPAYKSIFLQKLDSSANFIWTHAFGSSSTNSGLNLCVDSLNHIVLNGTFTGTTDFDISTATHTLTSTGSNDIFHLKLKQSDCSNFFLRIDSITNVGCNNIGYIETTPVNGSAPFNYSWNTGSVDSLTLIDTSGIYTVTVSDSNMCSTSMSVLINGPSSETEYDLSANLITSNFRSGFETIVWLDASNYGCTSISGQVKLTFDSQLIVNEVLPLPDNISGNTLTWDLNNLTYDSAHFRPMINFITQSSAQIGDSIDFEIEVTPTSGDFDTINNTKEYIFPVLNGYDPNDKKIYPQGECVPKFIDTGKAVTYTIRFQNTGNSEAINIYILDTLDTDLDLSTLKVVGSSHDVWTQVLPGQILKFHFDNIQLADSTSDEAASHGYIIFEINPQSNLVFGTMIDNSAGIYFDFNPVVLTNTTSNTLSDGRHRSTANIETVSACDTYSWNNQTYLTSGLHQQQLSNIYGCDSTAILNLDLKLSSSFVQYETQCHSFTLNSFEYYESGIYTQTLQNQAGCDSTLTLNLIIIETTDSIIQHTTCDNYSLNNQIYSSSGTYYQSLTNSSGCDSLITINLTVNTPASSNLNINTCEEYTLNGQNYNASGTYFQNLLSTQGCDSLITLNLLIAEPTDAVLYETTCHHFILNSLEYNQSGTYIQTLQNQAGCDSTLTLNLIIIETTDSIIQHSTCDEYSINNQTYTSSGTYYQTLTNSSGCDSLITINLTILSPSTFEVIESACNPYSLNGQNYTSTGTYYQLLTNESGCDSLITLSLTINENTDTTLTVSAINTYSLNGTTYEESGTYTQYILNQFGCDSTITLNLLLNFSNITENSNSIIQVSPNPFKENILLKNTENTPFEFQLTDLQGQSINLDYSVIENNTILNTSTLPCGLYLIRIITSSEEYIIRVIKQ